MSQFNKKDIVAGFNRAAATYDSACLLQNEIAQRLIEHLDLIPIKPAVIIDLGSATGYSLQLLQQRFPAATIMAIDIADRMLQKIPIENGFRVCVDYENLPLALDSADLIFSNLTFAWTDQNLVKNLQQLRQVLKPQGLLLFSTFGPDTLTELRTSWAAVDTNVHVHDFIDMHDIGDLLLQLHFIDPVMAMEYLTLSYPDAITLMRDLKATGCQNIAVRRFKALTGKQRFKKFLAEYQKYADLENNLPATYEIIYGHARRPESSADQIVDEKGEVRIAVSDIKSIKRINDG